MCFKIKLNLTILTIADEKDKNFKKNVL